MTRLSMNELTTYRWSFEEDVHEYAAAGIEGIGVWRQKLSDFGEERGIELLAESGLQTSSVLWAGGFTGSEGRTHRESVEDAIDALHLAAAMRADCVIAYSGARGGHTHNHARRLMRSALSELTPLAEKTNVTLAIEPMHEGCAADWTFLTSLDESLALLDEFDSPHVKLAFDTYHLAQSDEILDRLPELVPKLAIVQLGDSREEPRGEQNRCRLGDGRIPVRRIVEALVAIGYGGFFDVELMGEDIEASDYRELITQSRQTFDTWVGARK